MNKNYLLRFFLVVLGFEFRALRLLGRHTVHASSPFALIILEIRSHFFAQASQTAILFQAFHHHRDDRCSPPHPAFSVEMVSHRCLS
jgi:hypothetical protein